MQKNAIDKQQDRYILVIGLFLIVLCSFIYIDYTYFRLIHPDLLAKSTFKETECFVMSKKLSTKTGLWKTYRADVLVSYSVEGVQYNKWVATNGLDKTFTRDDTGEVSKLARYQVGGRLPCFYRPDSPGTVLVAFRDTWSLVSPVILPGVLGVLALLLFIKSSWRIIKKAKQKKRNKK